MISIRNSWIVARRGRYGKGSLVSDRRSAPAQGAGLSSLGGPGAELGVVAPGSAAKDAVNAIQNSLGHGSLAHQRDLFRVTV